MDGRWKRENGGNGRGEGTGGTRGREEGGAGEVVNAVRKRRRVFSIVKDFDFPALNNKQETTRAQNGQVVNNRSGTRRCIVKKRDTNAPLQ